LDEKNLHLKGELSPDELELETLDEVIHLREPVKYDLEVQSMEDAVLVQGKLMVMLDCECVRCLKLHRQPLEFQDWVCHLPLEGEEKVSVMNDCVDLTPHIREDIVLAFPQHPLCKPDCSGLAGSKKKPENNAGAKPEAASQTWAALDKLKL